MSEVRSGLFSFLHYEYCPHDAGDCNAHKRMGLLHAFVEGAAQCLSYEAFNAIVERLKRERTDALAG